MALSAAVPARPSAPAVARSSPAGTRAVQASGAVTYSPNAPSPSAGLVTTPNTASPGTAVAGAGFGTAMLGAFRTVSALAAPGQRASLIAAYFIASYAAFSIPVVLAGVATDLTPRPNVVACTVRGRRVLLKRRQARAARLTLGLSLVNG